MTDSASVTKAERADFYTLQQAAKVLQLSDRTLRKALDEGRIPYIEFGPKAIRISKSVVEALIRGEDLAS
jgi:excisionase family DNA binding protein